LVLTDDLARAVDAARPGLVAVQVGQYAEQHAGLARKRLAVLEGEPAVADYPAG
jgi:hypothetical protein